MHQFLFGVFPYIALTVLLVGSIARYERDPHTWKSSSSQFLRRKQLILGSILFHVGILVIFFGHLIGLLTPMPIFEFFGVTAEAKKILALVAGGGAGMLTLIGGALLLHRRLFDPRVRATSSFADNGILILLLVQVLLGIATIFVSLTSFDPGKMLNLMSWAQGIFFFDAQAASYIEKAPIFTQLHILLGLMIFVLFPFTRLVHMLSAPVRYIWRPGYQIVRSRKKKA